jgi:hypothetical protein
MRRAMEVLNGAGPQETSSDFDNPYDHPYFGQIFLAAIFYVIGFPATLNLDPANVSSIGMLYAIPRTVMGLLAVLDTLLVYYIASCRYNRNVAFMSSVLFAVMPFSWILRRIYLDNLLLPFLLSSIIFALYINNLMLRKNSSRPEVKRFHFFSGKVEYLVILSGVFFGIALFTKIPVFTFIPLVVFIVFRNTRSFKLLALWMIPVILIPMMWPLFSLNAGHFNEWLDGIYHQTSRGFQGDVFDSMQDFLIIDPILSVAGLIGIIYALIKRDIFILLWAIPFLLFSYIIGWFIYFHLALLLPIVCIAPAVLINDMAAKFRNRNIRNMLPLSVISCITIIGFISSLLLVTLQVNSNHVEAYAYVLKLISDNNKSTHNSNNGNNRTLLIAHWIYFWIPTYVLHEDIDRSIRANESIDGRNMIVVENSLRQHLVPDDVPLSLVYNKTSNPYSDTLDSNQYPYTSLKSKYSFRLGSWISIKKSFP